MPASSRTSRSPRQVSSADPSAPTPTAMIETELRPDGEPVLGLYLHVAYLTMMSSFGTIVGRGQITPAMIGVVTLLARNPGISQAELARLIGLERATVGATVARMITAGLVVRHDARHDGRSYSLYLSPRGQQMLRTIRGRIARHEAGAGGRLTSAERRQLRDLLAKLVYG